MVMLQMKVKLHFSDNLLLMLRKASPSAVLPKMEVSSSRLASLLTPHVPEKQLDPAILKVLFFSSLVQRKFERNQGRRSTSSVVRSHFSSADSFLDVGRTSALSSLIFIFMPGACLRVTQTAHASWSWARKVLQIQHNMSRCGVLSWRGIQTNIWT